jgi:hypothetical protein
LHRLAGPAGGDVTAWDNPKATRVDAWIQALKACAAAGCQVQMTACAGDDPRAAPPFYLPPMSQAEGILAVDLRLVRIVFCGYDGWLISARVSATNPVATQGTETACSLTTECMEAVHM